MKTIVIIQFDSKNKLFEAMDSLDIPYKDCNVVIFGSWYGSIIVAELSDKVKAITAIDLDDETIKIAKNRFFPDSNNISTCSGNLHLIIVTGGYVAGYV